ncbi:MAG: EamA family transporter [Candidatus Riflebacteria bacterium]|nr:EamA family transporter [Candidatus Riflebacteria bacterium]
MAAAIWGAAYPLTKGALAEVPPLLLGTGRFALAGLVLMVFTRSLPLQDIALQDRRPMVSLAFWGTFILTLGMNFGLRWAPATAASILSGTPPLFTIFLAAAWLGEPIQRRHFPAFILAIIGIALLAQDGGEGAPGWRSWIGCLLTLIPQIAWAIYSVLGKAVLSRYPWPLICRDTFVLGALMLAPTALIEVAIIGPGNWTPASIGVLLYLGILNSVVTYGLWNRALSTIPVTTASFILYLQPLTGAILGAILFHDRLGVEGIGGAILIFTAVTLVLR